MPFSSLNFLIALPILLMVYWSLPRGLKRLWILASSLIVYMAAGWNDLALLVAVTAGNWATSRVWPQSKRVPKLLIVLNVGVLAWFKYRHFLLGSIGVHMVDELIIPLGISFYVFQLISYQVELIRGVITEPPTFFSFFLYIFFFPHHQAGPIMRPHAFLGAFLEGRKWSTGRFKIGILLILWGLFKKIWIADWLMAGLVAGQFKTLHSSQGATGNALLLGVTYGIQIYADFSGYSDIAVGLGRTFGFKLDRNFHQPYLAIGPSEFWRRWHVTLSQWLRDHIYIPLGGNRHGSARTQLNLMIVMVVGGLWHGAGWCYVLWGFLHGSYLLLERWFGAALDRARWLKFLLFQILFMLAWIPFRETDLRAVLRLVTRADAWVSPLTLQAFGWGALIVLFSWAENRIERRFPRLTYATCRIPDLVFASVFAFLFLGILTGVRHETVFIYQRF